jgi:hypothetical protein
MYASLQKSGAIIYCRRRKSGGEIRGFILDFVFIFKIIFNFVAIKAPNTEQGLLVARKRKHRRTVRGFTVLVLLLSLSILRLVLKRASFD